LPQTRLGELRALPARFKEATSRPKERERKGEEGKKEKEVKWGKTPTKY